MRSRPQPTTCPTCGGRLETGERGAMKDKHLICAFCGYTVDVPDEYEVTSVEEEHHGGVYRRVEKTVRRRDIPGGSSSEPPDVDGDMDSLIDQLGAAGPDELLEAVRAEAERLGLDPDSIVGADFDGPVKSHEVEQRIVETRVTSGDALRNAGMEPPARHGIHVSISGDSVQTLVKLAGVIVVLGVFFWLLWSVF